MLYNIIDPATDAEQKKIHNSGVAKSFAKHRRKMFYYMSDYISWKFNFFFYKSIQHLW